MDINLNNVGSAAAVAAAAEVTIPMEINPPSAEPAPILGGASVTVTSAGTSDIAKLAAQLLQESDNAREKSIVGTFTSIGAAVDQILGAMADSVKPIRELIARTENEILAAQGELKALEATAKDAGMAVSMANGKVKTAQNAYDKAVADRNAMTQGKGESDDDFKTRTDAADAVVAEKLAALNAAKSSKAAADDAKAAADDAVTAKKGEIANLDATLVAAFESLDPASYRALVDAVLISPDEVQNTKPLEELEKDEEEKEAREVPLSERTPLEIMRDALEKVSRNYLDDMETRQRPIV